MTGRVVGARGRQRRPRLRGGRQRRRLAVGDGRRELGADRGRAPLPLLGRPAARLPTARSGTRRARRTPAARATSAAASTGFRTRDAGSVHAGESRRRQRARVHDDQRDPLLGEQGLGRDAPRRLVALARDDPAPWTLRSPRTPLTCRGGSTAGDAHERAVQEHRQRHRDRPEEPEHMVAAVGWRSGDAYNGFYETTTRRHTGRRSTRPARSDRTTSATSTFACSADGSSCTRSTSPRRC